MDISPVWFENESARGNDAVACSVYKLLDQVWLQDYRKVECGEPLSSMKRAISQPASDWGKSVFCLAASPSDNLINSLFRDTKCLRDTGLALTCFVSCPDFFIAFCLRRHQIRLWFAREWSVVEHLHDVKSSQPDVEASCGFEPPMGHRLPHAFRADGSFIFTLENAVSHHVNQLYRGLPLPTSPQSQATPKQAERNAEIRAEYKAGTSVPDLARDYGISKKRVYQILQGKRK